MTACDAAFHSGLDSLHAETHGEIGIFLWINGESLGDWVASAEYLGEAFRIHDRLQEWRSLGMVSSHLALCHEALGHLDQTLLADCVFFNCASGLASAITHRSRSDASKRERRKFSANASESRQLTKARRAHP